MDKNNVVEINTPEETFNYKLTELIRNEMAKCLAEVIEGLKFVDGISEKDRPASSFQAQYLTISLQKILLLAS